MNPERSTELLWGAAGQRGGLNLAAIVRAGIELADAEGLAGVSMRRVAERLGYTTMSLYRHVPGKAELVDLMRDAVLGDGPEIAPGPGAGWRERLELWAREALECYRRHPWLLDSSGVRHVPGPNAVAGFEWALGVVSGTGLGAAQVVAVVELVGGFVESAARRVVEAARVERRTGVGDEEWWGKREALWVHMDRYPTLSRIYRDGGYDAPLDPFEFGLQRVLDGVEVLVREGLELGIRDETRDETRDDSGDGRMCGVCGKVIEEAVTGRRREYCSRACQQRAYRRRKA
ncbi:TetR/AcrR family transcriptional regulator [Nonomuraea typhae]|uniref:TetR/AcrR family transcriptional regulator n=1 Tax=Nonomuraea typhae TaxID=2603600 RepID=UPI001FEB3465|nr:TetR/AcrR family transcriptional regulator [Nonomuraea typhae]